jgi:hypothetical protein
MRTTIRLAEESRDTLLSIAQERGEKGVSRVVEEAVAFYLSQRNRPAPSTEATTLPPSPPAGRWQRLGADLDHRIGADSGVLAMVRAMVRDGLRRLPILRA